MIYIGKVMKKVSRHMKLFLGLVVFIACISLVKLKMFAADSLTVGGRLFEIKHGKVPL